MWFLSPEQQKEQAALGRAVAGPMRAWWRRNRLFWIIAIAILAALLLAEPVASWWLHPGTSAVAPFALPAPGFAVISWLGQAAYYVYPVLVITVLLLWWLAALQVNRAMDDLLAEAALPHSPLTAMVRYEQALRQGLVPILAVAVIRGAHAAISALGFQLYSGELPTVSPTLVAAVAYALLWLWQLPVIMVWALALLAARPRKPLIGASLPGVWLAVYPLAYLYFAARWTPSGFYPSIFLDQPRNFNFLYAAELTPSAVAYLVYFLIGLALMLLALWLFRHRSWTAGLPLGIQLLLVSTASYAALLTRASWTDPTTVLPGGLPVEALQRVGAAAYQPLVTSTYLVNVSSPSLFIGIRSPAWSQLFMDYPVPILLVVLAINLAGLLLLKELAGWVLYRAELRAAGKSSPAAT
jgi:hypothetical protein